MAESLPGQMGFQILALLFKRAHTERRPCYQRELPGNVMADGTGCHHARPENVATEIDNSVTDQSSLTTPLPPVHGTCWDHSPTTVPATAQYSALGKDQVPEQSETCEHVS